ncbi:MAG: hypothetical protein K0R80_391 [Clostridia bacterium]|nr:hypothetical protein [Clostridia bacterium]
MSSTMRMWTEILFNIAYLIVIWILVSKMLRRVQNVMPKDHSVARNMMTAFMFLAIGDTGHVGFRVLSYYLGGLDAKLSLLGVEISLVGSGALATAVTITLFYVIMLDTWRKRFNAKYGVFEYILIVAAIIRLIMFLHPGNQWSSVIPPYSWSVLRNIPLMLQGLGVAYLILRDGFKSKDRLFMWIGLMILLSYACYLPVIFLVQKSLWIGMLMIPKTLAYLAIAALVYKDFFEGIEQITIPPLNINKGI